MKLAIKLGFIGLLAFIGLMNFNYTEGATCSLANIKPGWTKTTINIGDTVVLSMAPGENCVGQNALIDIYAARPFSGGYYIKTVPITFQSGSNNALIIFTAADYIKGGNDSVYENVYADVKLNPDNGPHMTQSDYLRVNSASSGSTCQLTGAKWSWNFSAIPILGSPIHMIVSATGCANYTVALNIWEDVTGTDYVLDSAQGKFDSTGNKLDVKWVANNKNDTSVVSSGIANYDLYFIASANGKQFQSGTIIIPANSENGCINCNSGLAPSVVQCADGTSITRGPAQDSYTMCVNNIGDAHSDVPGSGPGPGGLVDACIVSNKYVCDATTCSGKPTSKISSSDCDTTAAWSCIDANGKYACSEANKPDMSDQPLCTGRGPFTQIPASHCGQFPGATATQSYQYTITNPLAGGPESPFDIINIVSRWLFNISIPLAVMFILYAGFLMLTAGPNPAKVQEAKKIIINVVLALAIILIGRGFITLIRSVIELGGPG